MTKKHTSFSVFITVVALSGALSALFPQLLPVLAIITGAVFVAASRESSSSEGVFLALAALIPAAAVSVYLYGFSLSAGFLIVYTFLFIALTGLTVGVASKKGLSFISVLAFGGIACLVPFLVSFLKMKFIDGADLLEEFINKPVSEIFATYIKLLPADMEGVDELKNVMGELQWFVKQTLAMIVPSCFIIFCVSYAYIVFAAGRKLLSKVFGICLDYPFFRQLQMPRSASFALAVLFIISFFTGTSNFSGAVTNIIMVLSFFYVVCGIAVIDSMLFKKGFRPAFRILIYIASVFASLFVSIIIPFLNLPSVLLMLGIIDSSMDFRHLKKSDKGDVENER